MGAGSWGTTFAQVLCDAGTSTVLYARRPVLAKALRELHENPDYLPGVTLTPALAATSDAACALAGADVVAFAVPAQSLRSNLLEWAPLIPSGGVGRTGIRRPGGLSGRTDRHGTAGSAEEDRPSPTSGR